MARPFLEIITEELVIWRKELIVDLCSKLSKHEQKQLNELLQIQIEITLRKNIIGG